MGVVLGVDLSWAERRLLGMTLLTAGEASLNAVGRALPVSAAVAVTRPSSLSVEDGNAEAGKGKDA